MTENRIPPDLMLLADRFVSPEFVTEQSDTPPYEKCLLAISESESGTT